MADSTLLLAYMALVLAAEREEEYEDHLRRNIWKSNQLDDRTFLRMFRMTRPDFVWLVDQLRDALYQDEDDDDDPLSVETQVAVSLYYLGHGSAWSKLDELFGLDEGVAESTVRRFTTAVQAMNLSNNVVGVPAHTDIAAWDEISQRFLKKGGIPGVVGVIDTMPVPIKDPGYKRWLWLNRRGWPSIVVQAIVDAEGNFQDFSVQAQGSMRAPWGLLMSPIGSILKRGEKQVFPPGTFLLADREFTDSKWVMRPYIKNDNSEAALNFNKLHAKTWKIVDLTFRVLRARFRVLMTKQDATPANAVDVATTCMILHNLRNGRGQHLHPRRGVSMIKRHYITEWIPATERRIERAYKAGRLDMLTRRDDLAKFLLPK